MSIVEASGPPLWCEGYIGIPYLVGGRSKEGADCWNLAAMVLEERFGHPPLPNLDSATSEVQQETLTGAHGALGYALVEGGWRAAEVGDVLEMIVAGRPHCAVVVAPGWMIHARAGLRSLVERYGRGSWPNLITATWRRLS